MTCYEHIRKKPDEDELVEKQKIFSKLENYFRAVDDEEVELYHKRRGR